MASLRVFGVGEINKYHFARNSQGGTEFWIHCTWYTITAVSLCDTPGQNAEPPVYTYKSNLHYNNNIVGDENKTEYLVYKSEDSVFM